MHGWSGSGPIMSQIPAKVGFEQGRVVVVGACGEQVQGDPVTVAGHGAFGALFAPVNRAAAGCLTATGGFGDRPVDGEIGQV
jgi:hypothetical protein